MREPLFVMLCEIQNKVIWWRMKEEVGREAEVVVRDKGWDSLLSHLPVDSGGTVLERAPRLPEALMQPLPQQSQQTVGTVERTTGWTAPRSRLGESDRK